MRVVHLELHTGDLPAACAFYARLLGSSFERIDLSRRSYMAMDLGHGIGGGIVQCGVPSPGWIPYVEVGDVDRATDRAWDLGAAVLLAPREGPAGWRSVIADPAGGEVGLWRPKGKAALDIAALARPTVEE